MEKENLALTLKELKQEKTDGLQVIAALTERNGE